MRELHDVRPGQPEPSDVLPGVRSEARAAGRCADATGRPVQVSGVSEGAALGAAFLGRMAVGAESAITDAARWASIGRVVEPHPAWVDPAEERYRRFLELAGRPSSG